MARNGKPAGTAPRGSTRRRDDGLIGGNHKPPADGAAAFLAAPLGVIAAAFLAAPNRILSPPHFWRPLLNATAAGFPASCRQAIDAA